MNRSAQPDAYQHYFARSLSFFHRHGYREETRSLAESLNQRGEEQAGEIARFRTGARQVFCYAFATIEGLADYRTPACRLAAQLCQDHLDPEGFFCFSHQDRQRIELYDQAFALLMFWWMHRLEAGKHYLQQADALLERLTTKMPHPAGLGFRATLAPKPDEPLLFNPHMHLFEALLWGYEFTGQDRCLRYATDIYTLFQRSFFDVDTGSLIEQVNAQGHPLNRRFYPGHQFEWIWLLQRYYQLSGLVCSPQEIEQLRSLYQTGMRFHDPTGLVYLEADGAHVCDHHLRLWSQVEVLKGCAALDQLVGRGEHSDFAWQVYRGLEQSFFDWSSGWYRDWLDASHQPACRYSTTANLYHMAHSFPALRQLAGGTGVES